MVNVFIFIDALGWDLVERAFWLRDFLPYRRAVKMQFGYSCSAIPTILSGKRPAEHGHLGLFRWAPKESPFRFMSWVLRLVMHPRSLWNRGRVRHWVSKVVGRLLGFTGYFQLYQVSPEKLAYVDYCEKKDLFVPGGMGEIANLADLLSERKIPYHISDWRRTDMESFTIGIEAVRKATPFVFIYASSLDGIRHRFPELRGEIPEEVDARLAYFTGRVIMAMEAAKATGKPWSVTVISDHGMTPLTKTVDLKAAVESTGLVLGRDYGICYDSTMLRATFISPDSREKIMAAVKPFEADGHWLSPEEEREEGIWRDDRAFGDAIFLVNPGVQIVPSDMGDVPLRGMHGYSPTDPHSRAAILSTDPIPEWVQGVSDYFRLMKEKIDESER